MKKNSFRMGYEEIPSIGLIVLSLLCFEVIKIEKFLLSIPGLFLLLVLNLSLYFIVENKELNFGITIFLIPVILSKLYLSFNKQQG